mmetsp:Transcript_24600/g.52481  ORF Transcript_24600/g.52481 Transcript_24600/m.52481 type:complete len:568 (+) Transcript_24600:34-1737(+)
MYGMRLGCPMAGTNANAQINVMIPAQSRSEEIEKGVSTTHLLLHQLFFVMSIAVVASMLTFANATAPSSLRRRYHDFLSAVSNKQRRPYYLSYSCKSKRAPIYQGRRELRKHPSCSFTPTFSSAFNKYSPPSRTKFQSSSPTSWFRPSLALQCNDSNTTSLTTSCASSISTGEAADLKELMSQKIVPGATVYDALRSSLQLLKDHSIPEPDESVLHLLSHALNLSWENGYSQLREVLVLTSTTKFLENLMALQNQPKVDLAQQRLTPEQTMTFHTLLERRLQFEPLQYIVGQWDFHYLTGLKIKKPMLCPRPETEELVELVLADIDHLMQHRNFKTDEKKKIRVLDVGCGTGAIGIAIAFRYPKHVQVVALDVLPEAVDLSNENAATFLSGLIEEKSCAKEDVCSLYQAILCSAMDFTNNPIEPVGSIGTTSEEQKHEMNFDIIVSNPPYIPAKDMQKLSIDVVGYESQEALCGGDEGLDVIKDIVHRLPEWISPVGADPRKEKPRYCWMEVDDSHPSMLAKWLAPGSKESTRLGVAYLDSRKDFCGRNRFVLLSMEQSLNSFVHKS